MIQWENIVMFHGEGMEFSVDGAVRRAPFDHALLVCILLLTGAGLATLYSASYPFAERWYNGDRWRIVSHQSVVAVVGFILLFIAANINMKRLRKLVIFLLCLSFILCLLPFVPVIGVTVNGASRWIRVGPNSTFQPSEMVKLVLPLYLAHIFDKKQEKLDIFISGILPPALVTVIFFTVILMQNNFSTALFILINALFIFFLAGIKKRYFVGAAVMALPISFLLVMAKEHRFVRVMSFFIKDLDPQGAGFQVQASRTTISSGGFWGKGLGQGTRKIDSVPFVQNDFIFSAYSEESGFLGVIVFILIFAFFAWRGYRAALRAENMFPRLLACGMVTMIVTQMLLNIAVVAGAVPATGLPLPFFSAGGSSLIVTLAMSGLILNVSRARLSDAVGDYSKQGGYDD
jgi:cell division protein FtsW